MRRRSYRSRRASTSRSRWGRWWPCSAPPAPCGRRWYTPEHAGTIQRLNKLLVRAAGDDWDVRCQLPLTLGDRNEPEPDLAVVRAGEGSLLDRHPTTARLVIEVTSSSGTADRGVKARLYASSGIAEYWIVDVGQKVIEVHLDPDPTEGRYRASRTLQGGDAVVSTALPGLAFEVGRLFA